MNLPQPTKSLLGPETLIGDKYRLVQSIGKGSFGEVFLGHDIINKTKVAIKIEETKNSFSQLTFESKVYRYLSDGINIPSAKLFNIDATRKALVMELLGPSLEDLHRKCGRRFTLKTVCILADQMLSLLEYIHLRSIIHRDIKPDNFLMGLTQESKVYIVDFGLAKQFAVSRVVPHVKYNNKKCMIGTARYASINAHLGIEQSRRDDLESLGYVLLYFYLGNLPWQGITCENKNRKYDRICERKLMIPVDSLCRHSPPRFREYIEYTRRLRFDQKPDYYFLRHMFRQILNDNNMRLDTNFDWTYSDVCRGLFTRYEQKVQPKTLVQTPVVNNKTENCFRDIDNNNNPVLPPKKNSGMNINEIQKNVQNSTDNIFKVGGEATPRYNLRSYKKDDSVIPVTLTTPSVARKESFQSASCAKNPFEM